MIKILFHIHDLGQGGAEKVLVNLVNHLDPTKYDITVLALFGGGVNETALKEHVRYQTVFRRTIPGNSHWMKLFSPAFLHRAFVKEDYDIEVAYLEGPSSRIISGCRNQNTKLVSWIHGEQKTPQAATKSFRSYEEARSCYNRFDRIVGVSETVKQNFLQLIPIESPMEVLYNTVESERILKCSQEHIEEGFFSEKDFKLVAVGTLKHVKSYDRLIQIVRKLCDDMLPVHLYLLGSGPDEDMLRKMTSDLGLTDRIDFLGFQSNPYKYVSKCDLFVCSSWTEGFSTAATEALIVGTPVCTTDVSGMREMLGDNEYGVITENSEEALYLGIRNLITEPGLLQMYREKARMRGKSFQTERTVKAVEDMLDSL